MPDGKVIKLSDWREDATCSSWVLKEKYLDIWLTSQSSGTFLEIYQQRRRWCWPFKVYDGIRAWWFWRWDSERIVRWPVPPGWCPTVPDDSGSELAIEGLKKDTEESGD